MSTLVPEREEITPEPTEAKRNGEAPDDRRSELVTRDASAEAEAPVNVLLTSVAAFLAAAAAGWMCAGIFRGSLPRLAGLLGPLVGVGVIAVSYRTKRPTIVQYLALPACMLAAALLVLPDTTGGSANLPGLVAEAIRSGGLGQPPVAFDPGWRFLLVVLTGLMGAGAASLGVGLNKPKTGILLPVPLIFGAALVQPAGATLVSTMVALVLGIGAMAVAFGVDLAREGATSGNFEMRRLGRGAGVLAVLVAVLAGLSQLGFLFPEAEDDQIIPPKRPESPPLAKDRELFTVASPIQVPWRLGTLDVYQDNAWMTPPFNSGRLATVPEGGAIPFLGNEEDGAGSTVLAPPQSASGETFTATFEVSDIEGNIVPVVMTPTGVPQADFEIEYDPRTQVFRLPDGRPRSGSTYSVTAPMPPAADELKQAGPPGDQVQEFLEVPAAPDAVEQLLVQAPADNSFDRLQFVRNAFYQSVVAAGAGAPVDLPPSRVVDMLEGGEATPYEITAAEVLLARWAGVPSRLGYGYFGGERVEAESQTFSVRPNQGATWLEAYFEGHGWVPIVGTPPKAKSSINDNDKKDDPTIRPTEELALLVYVPVKLQSIQLLYEVVRYWLFRALPIAAAALLAFLFFPGVVKMLRTVLRRRWAHVHGPRGRVMVAYTEFRDAVNDFNFGDPIHTPLEFLAGIAPDREHNELAWLVTRGLWGDLARDLRPEDAQAAEEMGASLTKRVRRANGGLPRIIAFGSRASLRDPYTYEVPNLWPAWKPRLAVVRQVKRIRLPRRLPRLRRPVPRSAVLLLVFSLFLGGCVQRTDLSSGVTDPLPDPAVPSTLAEYTFVRESGAEEAYTDAGDAALVDPGRVFSIHEGDEIQGSFQMAAFKPGLLERREDVERGVLDDLGGGRFELTRIGNERVYTLRMPEQHMLLWFPPSGRYFSLMVARRDFEDADALFVRLLAFQRGESPDDVDTRHVAPFDPRRGVRD